MHHIHKSKSSQKKSIVIPHEICAASPCSHCLFEGRQVFASFHLVSLLSDAHLEFRVHTVYLSAGTSALRGGYLPHPPTPCISISYSFQSWNPVQIYNTRRNRTLVPSLSGYISERLWWDRSECAKITRHERHRKLGLRRGKKQPLKCRSGLSFFFFQSNYSSEKAQRRSSSRNKEGRGRGGRGTSDSRIPNPQFSRDLK